MTTTTKAAVAETESVLRDVKHAAIMVTPSDMESNMFVSTDTSDVLVTLEMSFPSPSLADLFLPSHMIERSLAPFYVY